MIFSAGSSPSSRICECFSVMKTCGMHRPTNSSIWVSSGCRKCHCRWPSLMHRPLHHYWHHSRCCYGGNLPTHRYAPNGWRGVLVSARARKTEISSPGLLPLIRTGHGTVSASCFCFWCFYTDHNGCKCFKSSLKSLFSVSTGRLKQICWCGVREK